MRVGIALRGDFTGEELRALAKQTGHAGQSRRFLTLALIYDGGSRTTAARYAGVGLQTVRDWVLRFNARGPAGLIDGTAPGNRPKLNAAQRAALAEKVEVGPIAAVDGVVRWRLADLTAWLHEEFGVSLHETTVGRTLRDLGYRKLTARPRHRAQDPETITTFKKTSPGR